MKLKKSFAGLMLAAMVLSAPASVILSESTVAIATTVVDNDFNTNQNSNQNNTLSNAVGGFLNKGEMSEEDQSVGDMLKGQRGFTSEQLAEASTVISPITNIIGYLTGGIVVIIMSLIFLMTALDLLYIAIPPVRAFLNTDSSGATSGYGQGVGITTRGTLYGNINGESSPSFTGKRRIQWISKAAIECAEPVGGGGGTPTPGNGIGISPTGNIMGQMNVNNMPNFNGNSGGGSGKGIGEYLKRRIGFMIVLAICLIVLTSSVLMDTGINLAMWFLKILDAVNKVIAV
jgi:hypothetical protein